MKKIISGLIMAGLITGCNVTSSNYEQTSSDVMKQSEVELTNKNKDNNEENNASIYENNEEITSNSIEETTNCILEETTGIDADKGYDELRRNYDYCLFSAEQWTSNGRLVCPFDLNEDGDLNFYEKMARFYVPDEALEQVSTQDILEFVLQWPYISLHVYEFPSYQLNHMSDYLNAFDYLLTRKDVAEVLINNYMKEEQYAVSNVQDNNITINEARDHAEKICVLELLLSMNEICLKMTQNERERCIEHAYDMWNSPEAGKEFVDSDYSYFFFHIKENDMLRYSEWTKCDLSKKTKRLLISSLAEIPDSRFL